MSTKRQHISYQAILNINFNQSKPIQIKNQEKRDKNCSSEFAMNFRRDFDTYSEQQIA